MTTMEHEDPLSGSALSGAALSGPALSEAALSGTERHRAVRRALAEARNLAQLQAEILDRLDQADRAGDDETVLSCHAELDHVMALIAETEQVRTGARSTLAAEFDLTCAGCGGAAEPAYAQPRLLGYHCTGCGWSGDDPDAQADRKRAEALDTVAAAIEPAARTVEEAMATLGHRGKQARTEGLTALRELHETLATVSQRLRRTQHA